MKDIQFHRIVKGIKSFKERFHGKLALQIMFVEQNKKYAKAIADIARDIDPDEIQINTPLRPNRTSPLTEEELNEIKGYFKGQSVIMVYEATQREIEPFDDRETVRRH